MGLFGSSGDSGADEMLEYNQEQDARRRARKRAGQARIDSYFDGGRHGVNPADEFDPSQKYYKASGKLWYEPGNLTDDQGPPAEQVRNVLGAAADHGSLFTARSEREPGFGEEFFNKRAEAYREHANPQVEEQNEEAMDDLAFALSRAGTLQSSMAADRYDEQRGARDKAFENVATKAEEQAQQARGNVADERARLTQMVQAGVDPSAVTNQMRGLGDMLRGQPDYAQIGPLFEAATRGIGQYQDYRNLGQTQQRVNNSYGSSPFGG